MRTLVKSDISGPRCLSVLAQRALVLVGLALVGWANLPTPATAQGMFSPVAKIDDQIVTGYEVEQRMLLLKVLNTPGDLREAALEKLIEERLQLSAARAAGTMPTDNDIAAGIAEFAARGNVDSAAFVASLAGQGVAPETFDAFVEAGVAWRNLVRAKFGALVQINEEEIDQELGLSGQRGTLEVLFTELFLPTNTPNNAAITEELAPQIAALTTYEAFEDAARRFSAGSSRENGGRVENWLAIRDLPPALRAEIVGMNVGEISPPIELPNAIGFFQLRAKREARIASRPGGRVDYITMRTSRARAEMLRTRLDSCTDIYGAIRADEKEAVLRVTQANSAVPSDVALHLARLDPGEAALRDIIGASQSAQLIVLCARLPAPAAEAGGAAGEAGDNDALRAQIRDELRIRKLTAFADGYLQQLRGDAVIAVK